jgi:hypothetical protein
MKIFSRALTTLLLACSASLMGSTAWASLESEQAALAQLSQALDEAKASLKALEADASASQSKAAEEQQAVLEATTAKSAAQASFDALTAQQTAKPNAETERKLKDAEYELMMSERKLSSAQKALERAEKKLLESTGEQKALQQQITQTEKSLTDQKALVEKIKANASSQATQAAQKVTEEAARKEAEARAAQSAAQQKAATEAEATRQAAAAAAEAQAKQQALVKQLGVDLTNCQALPTSPASTELTAVDVQLQAFALGELRRVNRLLEEKPAGDVAPLSPAPVLSGSKLKPCDPAQWQALKFGYLGNGQYRAETPVLAGEQDFSVKGVLDPIRRTIPETDNGAVYVFFLDVKFEGRYKLSAYKKSLFDQAPTQ